MKKNNEMRLETYIENRKKSSGLEDFEFSGSEEEIWAIQDFLSSYEPDGIDLKYINELGYLMSDIEGEDNISIFGIADAISHRIKLADPDEIDDTIKWVAKLNKLLPIDCIYQLCVANEESAQLIAENML